MPPDHWKKIVLNSSPGGPIHTWKQNGEWWCEAQEIDALLLRKAKPGGHNYLIQERFDLIKSGPRPGNLGSNHFKMTGETVTSLTLKGAAALLAILPNNHLTQYLNSSWLRISEGLYQRLKMHIEDLYKTGR